MPRIRTWTDEQFVAAVANSYSVHSVLIELGLCATGSAYETVRNNVKRLGLSTSHFTGQGWSKGKRGNEIPNYRLTSEYLVADGPKISSSKLKKRLLDENLLLEQCSLCNLGPSWNNCTLVLQLDHINGNKYDNRLENLRILCPNCHTQTETYCSYPRYDHSK